MDENEKKAIVEALLFTWGDPLSITDISSILEIGKTEAEYILRQMIDEAEKEKRGLKIRKIKNMYQIGTNPIYYDWIKKLNKPMGGQNLSNAALETLSIIAYKQPVIKADIEAIRGVKSDSAIYTLLDKGLIEERGRLDRIGRPIIYGTTELFLQHFGLENIDRLPELEEDLEMEIDMQEVEKEEE